jgi:hypothetical protein
MYFAVERMINHSFVNSSLNNSDVSPSNQRSSEVLLIRADLCFHAHSLYCQPLSIPIYVVLSLLSITLRIDCPLLCISADQMDDLGFHFV